MHNTSMTGRREPGERKIMSDEQNEETASAANSGTVNALVGLDDCLVEINQALNYWYPLESEGCDKTECDARHIRLFQFRDRLAKQLSGLN